MLGRPSFTMPLPSVMVPCDTSPAGRDVPSPSGGRDVEGERARAESISAARRVGRGCAGYPSSPDRRRRGCPPPSVSKDPEDVEQPDRAPEREEPEEKTAEDAQDEDDERPA